jgi:hypothetical protein
MNWSFGAVMIDVVQWRPPSNDSATPTSEFVVVAYGSVDVRCEFRMSDHDTARCCAFVGSAVRLPALQVRKTESWYVVSPNAETG